MSSTAGADRFDSDDSGSDDDVPSSILTSVSKHNSCNSDCNDDRVCIISMDCIVKCDPIRLFILLQLHYH